MKTIHYLAILPLFVGAASCATEAADKAPEPIRLIVETDMGNDIDDALAFDLIYKAMDEGKIELLAIGNHKESPTATDYTELAKLLESPADSISPLPGRELVARKVRQLSIMAGSYGEKQRAEYNVVNDIPAMQRLFAEWETPIVQNPFELGKRIMYPGSAIENDFDWAPLHPVAEGYRNYHKMPYDRATWDLLSVVWLLHPELFTESEPGRITVDDKGFTHFTPDPEGKDRWLTASDEQAAQLREYIVQTTTRAPKHHRN